VASPANGEIVMDALTVSNSLLWVIVIIQSLLIFALMRQIGVLHERVFPAGALMTVAGPVVGEAAPVHQLKSLSGTDITVGGKQNNGKNTLLLFVSPSCPICKTLLPTVKSVLAAEKQTTDIILASDAESASEQTQHEQFVHEQQLPADRYVLSRPLGLSFMVEKLPFAALIDKDGILRAKGLVNSREHLESLFEAQARGVASLQQFLSVQQHEPHKRSAA
jgi:methylamine dehydrogenase accessory protein MauD